VLVTVAVAPRASLGSQCSGDGGDVAAVVRRLLGAPAAVYLWLAVTLAGVVAVVVGHAVWAVVGWAVGGVAAVVVVAIQRRRGR
jgi:hypothetical protein